MSILVENLTKIYGEQRAIDSISFSIEPGEIVGFLGPNGAGKSTTMKILSGYIQASSGKAKVLDLDVVSDAINIKKRIGYLPELNPLYTDMYITEYLDFNARVYKIKDRKAAVNRVIETTGLGLERKKKIGQLSKGYKQRVGLAQALLNNPEVLILDEPTSGLDPNQMQEIRQLIIDLGKDKTILLSSHIMQEVEAMCNRVIIINRGKIVADDQVDNIKHQMHKEGKAIEVKFRDEIDTEKLKAIDGINEVEVRGETRYSVSANADVDLPAVLFQFAIESNTIIVEQKEQLESLESIFQQLTKNV